MDYANASGIIPMFLSGHAFGEACSKDTRPKTLTGPPLKRLLLICSGSSLVLSGTAKTLAFEFGRKNVRTTLLSLSDTAAPGLERNFSRYDGIFIGIAPEGTGSTERAFSFIRTHLVTLSSKPVALFFLLSRAPKLMSSENLFKDLSLMYPLDVKSFDRTAAGITTEVTEWARNDIWPRMETAWLADLLFPEPAVPPVEHAVDKIAESMMSGV